MTAAYTVSDYTLNYGEPLPVLPTVVPGEEEAAASIADAGFEWVPTEEKTPEASALDSTAPAKSFVEAMLASDSNLTTTENGAPTHASTLSSRLDFFFDIVQGSDKSLIRNHLFAAWAEDPLDTLKLIFQLRDVRDGKGIQFETYEALLWLLEQHPETLLANLPFLPEFGYWKDLSELLLRVTLGVEAFAALEQEDSNRRASKGDRYNRDVWRTRNQASRERRGPYYRKKAPHRKSDDDKPDQGTSEIGEQLDQLDLGAQSQHRAERIKAHEAAMVVESESAKKRRDEQREERRARLRARIAGDPFYRRLHVETARLFAVGLRRDLARTAEGKSVSLVAKWAPTPRAHHDRHTLLATTIARLLYPESEHRKEDESEIAYVMRIRIQYQRDYLTPLRAKTPVAETLMSRNDWHKIRYQLVPSVCMKKRRGLFIKHDKERFNEYLESVQASKSTIKSGALSPHELVQEVLDNASEDELSAQTRELQWRSYVDALAKSGVFDGCTAVCDVSGSMSGTPMHAAIALSLLVAELTAPPFNQMLISFSESPVVHEVKGSTLQERVQNVSAMDWGYTTNFQAVFDLILARATAAKLAPEAMVKRLFVFSDMEFDAARGRQTQSFQTDHEQIVSKYQAAGYAVPEIIYWNLRGADRGNHGASKPVTKDESGVAMVSGFSGQMLKLFLSGSITNLTPWNTLRAAIDLEKYAKLLLVD